MTQPTIAMLRRSLRTRTLAAVTLMIALAVMPSIVSAKEAARHTFDVPAGDAEQTLRLFTQQSGEQILYPPMKVNGVRTNAVKGELTSADALNQMLGGTTLTGVQDAKTGSLTIRREKSIADAEKNGSRAAQDTDSSDRPEKKARIEDGLVKLDTFEVMDSKLLNMDVKRSRDDAQPYVVFDRHVIQRSGATTISDFLRQRLPMNTQSSENVQSTGSLGATSAINLRGLGTTQTLILVDGHRISSGSSLGNSPGQPDINGIPLAAIERIEVLPTTASAIYGGGATGGVVNIILRRDYSGAELTLSYDNTFSTDSAIRRIDFSYGTNCGDGATSLLVSGSYSSPNVLVLGDRDFLLDGRNRIIGNNPTYFSSATNPPLGRTTNIRSVNGSPLFGAGTSSFTFVPVGYAGGGGLAALQANAGKYNLTPASSAQPAGGRNGLYDSPRLYSLGATLRHQFGARLQGFLEAGVTSNLTHAPTSSFTSTFTLAQAAPNNPFGQAVLVTVPLDSGDTFYEVRNDTQRIVAGMLVHLSDQWRAGFDYTFSRSRYGFYGGRRLSPAAVSAIAAGTIDILRDTSAYPIDLSGYTNGRDSFGPQSSTLNDWVMRAAGPIAHLPAGEPVLSALVERRDEKIGDALQVTSTTPQSLTFYPSRSQAVTSGYAELRIPIVAAEQNIPFVRDFEAQLSLRHDYYQVNASTPFTTSLTAPVARVTTATRSTNPLLGLRYQPVDFLTIRASYGTGFIPPSVVQVTAGTVTTTSGGAVDPRRGNQVLGTYDYVTGGSTGLRPETSRSESAGIVLTPPVVPRLRVSLDYTRIEKKDNITTPTRQQILDNEALFPGLVTRTAPAPGDPYSVGPVTRINATLLNALKSEVEAFDLQADYRWEVASVGTVTAFALATWETHYKTQLALNQPLIENVGTASNFPLKFKANAGLGWNNVHWSVSWIARYLSSYYVANPTLASSAPLIAIQGNGGRVSDQWYHDVVIGYRFEPADGRRRVSDWLRGTEIEVGVHNLFNTRPPYDVGGVTGTGFPSLYSPFGDPRLMSYFVRIKKAF